MFVGMSLLSAFEVLFWLAMLPWKMLQHDGQGAKFLKQQNMRKNQEVPSGIGRFHDNSLSSTSNIIHLLKAYFLLSPTHGLKYLKSQKMMPKLVWSLGIFICLFLAVALQIVPSLNDYNQMHREDVHFLESGLDEVQVLHYIKKL